MPIDYGSIGRTVKQKYPDYANFSDEEIGQRVVQKYPQYGQVPQFQLPYTETAGLTPEPPGPTALQKLMIGTGKLAKKETLPNIGQLIAGIASVPVSLPFEITQPTLAKGIRATGGVLGRTGGEVIRQGIEDISENQLGIPFGASLEEKKAFSQRQKKQLQSLAKQFGKSAVSEAIGEFIIGPAIKGVTGKIGQLLGKTPQTQVVGGQVISAAGKPAHQVALENAYNKGDFLEVKKILDNIPINDPYKKPMESLFRQYAEEASGELGSKVYASSFQVPTKLARKLKPLETSKEMLRYGIKGSLPTIDRAADVVTGDTGIITQMTRDALGKVQGEIPMASAATAAKEVLANSDSIPEKQGQKIIEAIFRNMRPGVAPNTWNALDAFDAARDIEKIGYEHWYRGINYLSPSIKHQQIAKVYLAAADEIKDSLEKVVADRGTIELVKTPARIAALQGLSPKLAKDVAKATSFSELRHLASPFARIKEMVRITQEAQTSAFNRFLEGQGGLLSNLPKKISRNILLSPFTKTGAAALLEALPEPQIDLSNPLMAAAKVLRQEGGLGVTNKIEELLKKALEQMNPQQPRQVNFGGA